MPAYHDYPAHKRHPNRDSRRALNKPRTKVFTLRVLTPSEYELLKPYISKRYKKAVW